MTTHKFLADGGFIANYRCHAACAHCLYGSSPDAEPGYVSEEDAARICRDLRRLGCRGLHVGGGEPFTDPLGMAALIRAIEGSGIGVDYIETNAAWITGNIPRDREILLAAVKNRSHTVMISADPFHVEFIPFWKPVALLKLLREEGYPFFIWQQRYWTELLKLDPTRTYTPDELREALGYDLAGRCVKEYGMGFNGRALKLLRASAQKKPHGSFLSGEPCGNLNSVNHFHADYLGRFIAPGCTGFGILTGDLGVFFDPTSGVSNYTSGVSNPTSYPVCSRLYSGGTSALFAYAQKKGFVPADGYVSKCDLCFGMRKFLYETDKSGHPDLTPGKFYESDF